MFDRLSTETIFIIFRYLHLPKDILALAKVNKRLYTIYQSHNKIQMFVSNYKLPLRPILTYGENNIAITSFNMFFGLPTNEKISVSPRIMQQHILPKVYQMVLTDRDIDKMSEENFKRWNNLKQFTEFHVEEIFTTHVFPNLRKLLVESNDEISSIPNSITGLIAKNIKFEAMQSLEKLMITNREPINTLLPINIDPIKIKKLCFSAKRHIIPNLKEMINLDDLEIHDSTNQKIELPENLNRYLGYNGYQILPINLKELHMTISNATCCDEISNLSKLQSISIHLKTQLCINIFNSCVNEVILHIYEIPHILSNLSFPNAKKIIIHILNVNLIWNILLFVNNFLKQYQSLNLINIILPVGTKITTPKKAPLINECYSISLPFLDCKDLITPSINVMTKFAGYYKFNPLIPFHPPQTIKKLYYHYHSSSTTLINIIHFIDLVHLTIHSTNTASININAPKLSSLKLISDKQIDDTNFKLICNSLKILYIKGALFNLTHISVEHFYLFDFYDTIVPPTNYQKLTTPVLSGKLVIPSVTTIVMHGTKIVDLINLSNVKKILLKHFVDFSSIVVPENCKMIYY